MSEWTAKMQRPVQHLAEQLRGIRPGTLSVGFVDTFRVPVHGNLIPIRKLATVASRGDRILITPLDRDNTAGIVKALVEAKLNAYALNPTTITVGIPPISGEQRTEMVRHVKKLGEEAKVAIRSIRQDSRKQIAARGRGSQRAVQDATDAAVAEVERLIKAKIAELGS
jgi:ribosome recycling factor